MPFKTKSGDTLEILYLEELSPEVSGDFFISSHSVLVWFVLLNFIVGLAFIFVRLRLFSVLVVDAISLFPAGGFCEGTSVQQYEDMGTQSCRLGPHVPEHSADNAHHLHTG